MNHERDRDTLGGLYADREPPAELEEHAVDAWRAALREEGAVAEWRRQVGTSGLTRNFLRLAASLVLFGAGWGTARMTAPAAPATSVSAPVVVGGEAYMLLLWQGPDFAMTSPDGGVEEYSSWAMDVARRGIPIMGDELSMSRITVTAPDADPSPADESHISGYFILETGNVEQAVELARGHPHLGHRGWVEVAPIVSR